MAIEVFNRVEKKYMIDICTYEKIQSLLKEYMVLDAFNQQSYYTIANIYYDTSEHDLIRRSIESPAYKEKLRLRGYGVPSLTDKVYLEIKKKYDGIVNKRRCAFRLDEAYQFLKTGRKPALQPYMNEQVLNEIECFLQQYPLHATTYLAYDRKAYFGKNNRDLRISFDTNIRTRKEDLQLEIGDSGRPLVDENKVLMEIKTSSNMPMWLVKLLSANRIYPSKFSKYGTAFIQSMTNEIPTQTRAKPIIQNSQTA